jgi:glycine amidinotransferase
LQVVNSSNEGDSLKQVIVGRAEGTLAQAVEPTVGRDWREYEFPLETYGPVPDLRA